MRLPPSAPSLAVGPLAASPPRPAASVGTGAGVSCWTPARTAPCETTGVSHDPALTSRPKCSTDINERIQRRGRGTGERLKPALGVVDSPRPDLGARAAARVDSAGVLFLLQLGLRPRIIARGWRACPC